LPGEGLRWWHIAGTAAGLGGAALLVTSGGAMSFRAEYALGYGAALACALTWSSYSVLSRRFGQVPTDVVGGYCGATALLGLLFHLLLEQTRWPADGVGWAAIAALGLGPVGAAFFVWDHGVKRGDIKALGAFAYASPLLSTVLLIAFGRAEASWSAIAACALITAGAIIASRDLWRR
jgi:drug/metabolite transporter (DMT)-like permease